MAETDNIVGRVTIKSWVKTQPAVRRARMTEREPANLKDVQDLDLSAESLIEEVSIDGMCGVY